MRCDLLEIIITDAGPTNSSIFMSISKLAILAVIHIRIGGRNCARDLVRYKGWWNMSKRNLILSIICWVVLLITVVCWIVTYFGLFSMDQHQSMLYIGFYRIEICGGWSADDIPAQLSRSFERIVSSEIFPPEYFLSYFNFGAFDDQVRNSLASFHLGYALITALSLAGGVVFTVLLAKKKKSQ